MTQEEMQKKLSIEQAETQEYKAFKEKFKSKLTTDDCYTPPEVYEAVKEWVLQKCPQVQALRIVRPFYPEGDYTREDYTDAVVIDNPPFSILAEIKLFYLERGIPFFLFAPSLTLLSSESVNLCSIVADAKVTYHNGAVVSTSFVSKGREWLFHYLEYELQGRPSYIVIRDIKGKNTFYSIVDRLADKK